MGILRVLQLLKHLQWLRKSGCATCHVLNAFLTTACSVQCVKSDSFHSSLLTHCAFIANFVALDGVR